MKVAHLVPYFEPHYTGGIQNYVAELARQQQRMGLDVSIITAVLPERNRPTQNIQNVRRWNKDNASLKVIRLKSWLVWQRTPLCPSLIPGLKRLKVDVVHLHSPSPWFELALLLANQNDGNLVITLHNGFPEARLGQRFFSSAARRLLYKAMDSARSVIAPHAGFLPQLLSPSVVEGCRPHLHLIPPGVDHSRFSPLETPRDEKRVLFVAHLREEKGLDVLVEAMAEMADLHLDVLASVSYESSYYRRVRDFAVGRLGSRVSFFINPDHESLLKAYNRAACVVVPSTGLDSWNMVLLEAAACGTACVRSELPGLAWAGFALTAPPGDAGKLATAIRETIERRPELGLLAKKEAAKYTWERTCRDTVSVYQ